MNLQKYFQLPGGMDRDELAKRIGVKSIVQIHQWERGYAKRKPSPGNARRVEDATGGKVMRWDLRPKDWAEIWPEMIGTTGAPRVKKG